MLQKYPKRGNFPCLMPPVLEVSKMIGGKEIAMDLLLANAQHFWHRK